MSVAESAIRQGIDHILLHRRVEAATASDIPILLQERDRMDLFVLEGLLENKRVTPEHVLQHLIFDWSRFPDPDLVKPLDRPKPSRIKFQWEGLRDGEQHGIPGILRLSTHLDVVREILPHLPDLGVTVADLGMPISGKHERDKILSVIDFLHDRNIPITPAVAGRTHPDDVTAIKELAEYVNKKYGINITVYAFVGSSRIRMLAEGQGKWNLNNIATWTATTIEALRGNPGIGSIIIPFEDTYGTHPSDIQHLFRTALDAGAKGICICDTCSRGHVGAWTQNLIRYVGNTIAPDYPDAVWELHTHNMLGVGAHNAIEGFREGLIDNIHATLGGVGDLGGNSPLEEVVHLAMLGGLMPPRNGEITHLRDLVNLELRTRNIDPAANPFSGGIRSPVSFIIPTGVHAAAFERLEEIGPHMRRIFERVYFPLSPSDLGFDVNLAVVTPVSGKSNVYALAHQLDLLGLINPDSIQRALYAAKVKGEPLTEVEFRRAIEPIPASIQIYVAGNN